MDSRDQSSSRDIMGQQEQIEVLKKSLEECQIEQNAWKEKFLQITADFQNLQKRFTRDQSQWVHTAQAKILVNLLPIVDDFDRAVSHMDETQQTQVKGFILIYNALQKFFKEQGVQEFSSYEQFDPSLHEALLTVKSDKHTSGSIVQVLRKGYMFNGSVLRIAQVSVAE